MNVPASQAGQAVACAACGQTYQVPSSTPIGAANVPPSYAPTTPTSAPAPVTYTPAVPSVSAVPTIAAKSRLPALEQLPPPSASPAAPQKASTWAHEKRSQPKPRETEPADSPTMMLPPVLKPGDGELPAAPREKPATSAFPSLPLPTLPAAGGRSGPQPSPLTEAASRDDLAALDARLRRAEHRFWRNVGLMAFGMIAMVVFAAFVIQMSKPK